MKRRKIIKPGLFYMKHTIGFLTSLAALFQGVATTPLLPRYGDYVVHEKRDFFRDARTVRRLNGDVVVPLRIGLLQQNLDTLSAHLMAVSDPESPMYGEHWSPERVVEVFAPSADSHDAVRAWLLDAGFDASRLSVSHNKAWIEVKGATASEAEALLNTEYHVFEHDGEEHVGMLSRPFSIVKMDVKEIFSLPRIFPTCWSGQTH